MKVKHIRVSQMSVHKLSICKKKKNEMLVMTKTISMVVQVNLWGQNTLFDNQHDREQIVSI